MDKLMVTGPCKLKGNVHISSSKNASLPILAGVILANNRVTFTDLPGLSDINFFINILGYLGSTSETNGKLTHIDAQNITKAYADYDLVRKMRASILVLGPLLARFGKATVSLPGGCAIGTRPVDIHLKGMEALGAKIEIHKGYIEATCDKLVGTYIRLSFPSVGATENIMMAAVCAEGETVIDNAAQEPEIVDHAEFLVSLGAKISGAGTSKIVIQGVPQKSLMHKGTPYRVIGDRIEAATFIIAGLMCNSEIKVSDFNPTHLTYVLDLLQKMGAKLEIGKDYVKVFPSGKLKATRVETAPYPGFPTDVQAQLMALMGICEGHSIISEHIFENRYMHVPELVRMGMNIKLDGHNAMVDGTDKLSGAPVMCTDLRASAALVLAALVADGTTEVNRIYHLDRGYEKLEVKFKAIGANIERVKG